MVTASVYDPPNTTSSASNLPLQLDTTTSIPTSTDRILVLEEIHTIQCAISTTNIAIELRQALIRSLETRLVACLDASQDPSSAMPANKETTEHASYPYYVGFAHADSFPASNALTQPTPPTPCYSTSTSDIPERAKSLQCMPSTNINASIKSIPSQPIIDLIEMSIDSSSIIVIDTDTDLDDDKI